MVGGLLGSLINSNSSGALSAQPWDRQSGSSTYDLYLMRQYGLASARWVGNIDVDHPEKKAPERPIEQVQAEVDEWLKDVA